MLVLGIETSCDETGIALLDTKHGLLSHTLHSQVAMHSEYGGVVPELASRDHIRYILPLIQQTLLSANRTLSQINAIAYTQGPGLAGALLVGASVGAALSFALNIPAIGIHHLEGHLLSPLLSKPAPDFPFIALLVSGGHTQLMQVSAVGQYVLLGETVDDAAGEAFDKTAKLLGLGYPGGAALSKLAYQGQPGRFKLPRPMLNSKDLNFSFSGLKTAVLTLINKHELTSQTRADIALAFQDAIVEVLVEKSLTALSQTSIKQLIVAGGVGANNQLRDNLSTKAKLAGATVFYPELEFCTDNGAMIALAGALRLSIQENHTLLQPARSFTIQPRWNLAALSTIDHDSILKR
ncbi:O-sialoglycoprotein endopeptidase [Nitrosomonas sp. PY1]|uniref:tRNA (adenosine(37)-N6)-threonylcarbamoyltransferase complex transferase subunit TsaD n=1 Tax=Nitrosomonas sp. PY1 TaxID=1803906 RepID=UPI001FC7C3B7|nr:tRNA (adenosine(37)-N6)-threonylcarbamoyltransferase complex transferase subunit TsaD [Nitrosomonas sp. PY1]GKS68914.1 O-sialoglycoprotein endopeptidase [Nitrosomonas sp. PY1]